MGAIVLKFILEGRRTKQTMLTKKSLIQTLAASTAALVLAAVAMPASANPTPRNRYIDQQERLQQGLKSGQLTKGEYARNEARLQAINAQRKADLKANGGTLTSAERKQLQGEYNGNSRGIYFSKHNDVRQPGAKNYSGTKLPAAPKKGEAGYVGDRIQRQFDRLHNGAANGSLTRAEYLKDSASLHSIEAQRAAWMKAQGGQLTADQQAQLTKELNASGDQLYDTKHNGQHQPGA